MRSAGELGQLGEDLAAGHLQRAGLEIVARNWRCAQRDLRGELDIVARDGATLVFCEVKARRGAGAIGAFAAITPRKQAQLRRLAAAFLAERGVRTDEVRFDAVGVDWSADGRAARLIHLRGVC